MKIIVRSVTFDGTEVNFTMAKKLGACFDVLSPILYHILPTPYQKRQSMFSLIHAI